MINFNDKAYSQLIGSLINDVFYINASNGGKISGMRKFSEILVRKILDIGDDRTLMLGKIDQPILSKKGNPTGGAREELNLLNPLRKERLLTIIQSNLANSNDASHTKRINPYTDIELNNVINALFDLYAFLFEEYFFKYPISSDTNPIIFTNFSLIPPIIRYKTLSNLYTSGHQSIYVADRLVLSMLKSEGKEFTMNWLNKNKDSLLLNPYPDDEQKKILFNSIFKSVVNDNKDIINSITSVVEKKHISDYLIEIAQNDFDSLLINLPYSNEFELLFDKINRISDYIDDHGVMYSTFETAFKYYQNYITRESSLAVTELNQLIDFVYIGRKDHE